MSNKNAYEIRLEILKEANSNLWNCYHNLIEAARLNAKAAGDESGSFYGKVIPPSPEAINEYAEKLYKFVTRE